MNAIINALTVDHAAKNAAFLSLDATYRGMADSGEVIGHARGAADRAWGALVQATAAEKTRLVDEARRTEASVRDAANEARWAGESVAADEDAVDLVALLASLS